MVREDVSWLVKSSGRILGPFPSSKVMELLKTREISVLDEISEPTRRWQTLQYHDEFKEIIDTIRKTSLSEKTEATWTPTGSGTSNLTQTLTDMVDSELTEELPEEMLGFTNTAKEIVVEDVKELPSAPSLPPTSGRYQPQNAQNTAIQRQVEKTTRGLWAVTILVLLAVAAFILNRRIGHGGLESKSTPQVIKQTVTGKIQVGKYVEALKDLKTYYPDPALSGDLSIYYGALLVQVDGSTLLARRLLNQLIINRRPEMKQAYTVLGIADMNDGQLDAAQDDFDRALGVDPTFTPAIVNESFIQLQRGNYTRAKVLAQKALQLMPNQPEAMLSLCEAEVYAYKNDHNEAELAQVMRALKDFRTHQSDFSAEIGFYSLYFDLLKQEHGFDDRVREYLDNDPRLTEDHRHSLFIYRGHKIWDVQSLGTMCEQVSDKMADRARASTLFASCLANDNRWDKARHAIEKAVQQAPKDALIQAWYSYILKESGDGDQASVVLARAGELNRKGEYMLPLLLQARFCAINSDAECARDSYQKLYERDLEYLPAVSGLAWVYANRNEHGEALKLLDRGLKKSPDYIPLLLLKQKAEHEGWYAGT